MATTSFQSLHKPPLLHHLLLHHQHCFSTPDSSLQFFKHSTTTTTLKLFSSLSTSSLTPSTNTSPFDTLAAHLAEANFRQADEETRRLLIELAGESAQKRGYVFFSEVQFISAIDLRAIDRLWRLHSSDRFGYSVQRRIWERKTRRDFTGFFIRVGWMKKLDTEVEQYNYKAFPDEFIWELRDDTPEGHLPLTNALRGTQLLASILTHPAFEELEEEETEEKEDEEESKEEVKEKPKLTQSFKPDYSF
ncbi:GUN4-like protein [Dioscorea alata]|uniref:GUN4-like protein n=1 Tax=Dioscorea alata TaxID=55571 RepID=A0ACB7W131_DIOAL|nr:GUN4-like protein [Dioscorea alata]